MIYILKRRKYISIHTQGQNAQTFACLRRTSQKLHKTGPSAQTAAEVSQLIRQK